MQRSRGHGADTRKLNNTPVVKRRRYKITAGRAHYCSPRQGVQLDPPSHELCRSISPNALKDVSHIKSVATPDQNHRNLTQPAKHAPTRLRFSSARPNSLRGGTQKAGKTSPPPLNTAIAPPASCIKRGAAAQDLPTRTHNHGLHRASIAKGPAPLHVLQSPQPRPWKRQRTGGRVSA